MRSVLRYLGLCVLVLAGIAGTGYLGFKLYLAERPQPSVVRDVPVRVTDPLTRRVVIVIVDSLREEASLNRDLMPTWNRLADQGVRGINMTPPMTLTAMSVVNLGSGLTPSVAWSLKNFDAEPFADEHLFRVLSQAGHKVALLGDASWTQLYGESAAQTLAFRDKGFWEGVHDGISGDDLATFQKAAEVLSDESYSAVVLHVVSSDKAAHRAGAHLVEADGRPSDYARALRTIDRHLADLYERHGRESTWFMISDHGCTVRGNHGGGEQEARRAPFVMAGPGVRPGQHLEQPMSAIAPTVAALFGLRAPRVAEVSAAFEYLTHDGPAQVALGEAHLAARESYVGGYLDSVLGDHSRLAAISGRPATVAGIRGELHQLDALLSTVDRERSWLRPIGLTLGLFLQLSLMGSLARMAGARRPWAVALVWSALGWLLLYTNSWQQKSVEFLGLWPSSPSGLLLRLLILTGVALLTFAFWRLLERLGLSAGAAGAWVVWGVLVLVISQSVLRWPYGPLPEMLRALVLLTLVGLTTFGVRARTGWARAMALAGGVALVWYALMSLGGPAVDDRGPSDTTTTAWIANGALLALSAGLALQAVKTDRSPASLGAWGVALVLLAGAIAYQEGAERPWLIKLIILGAFALVASLGRINGPPVWSRNLLIVIGLVLYRALSLDQRVMVLIGVALLALIVSGIQTGRSTVATALAASVAVLAHQSYFYEAGYHFSFSALDMTVVFAATKDTIQLGEGFLLLMIQHLGPWLVIASALIHNRLISGDQRGIAGAVFALLGTFVVQAWSVFVAFEYEVNNHWYTMHAVPMVVFALCNAGLVAVSVGAALAALDRRWDTTVTHQTG